MERHFDNPRVKDMFDTALSPGGRANGFSMDEGRHRSHSGVNHATIIFSDDHHSGAWLGRGASERWRKARREGLPVSIRACRDALPDSLLLVRSGLFFLSG